jgi:hypothetical protein
MAEANNYNFKFLRWAVKVVPFIKYAVGLLAIATVISSVSRLFKNDIKFGVWGIVIGLALMAILFLFSKFLTLSNRIYKSQVILLSWSMAIFFIVTISFIISSVFFNVPLRLCKWIDPNCLEHNPQSNPVTVHQTTEKLLEESKDKEIWRRKNETSGVKSSKRAPLSISIQLPQDVEGFKEIYINDHLVEWLPESTPLNLRLAVDKSQIPLRIMIISTNNDTCTSFLSTAPDASTYRIVPNCN